MNRKDLIKTLSETEEGISEWVLETVKQNGVAVLKTPRICQVSSVSPEIPAETNPDPRLVLGTENKTYKLRVFNVHDKGEGNKVGESFIPLPASYSQQQVTRSVGLLANSAALPDNPLFSFPNPGLKYTRVKIADPEILGCEDLGKRAVSLMEEIQDNVARHPGVEVADMECFIKNESSDLRTGRGIQIGEVGTKVSVVLSLATTKGSRRGEYNVTKTARRLKDLDIPQMIETYAGYALASAEAVRPKSHHGAVTLMGDAVADFFATDTDFSSLPLDLHTSGIWKFQGMSLFDIGGSICREKVPGEGKGEYKIREKPILGDKITIVSDPHIPFATRSSAFSHYDGIPTRKTVLVKDSTLETFHGSQKYHDYLKLSERGLDPTGPLGSLVVSPGTRSVRDLLNDSGPVYIVKAWSAYMPDPFSGNVNLEIRLGSVIEGGIERPIRNALFVGNLFDMMANMHLSSETVSAGSYRGPAAVRFNDVTITGE